MERYFFIFLLVNTIQISLTIQETYLSDLRLIGVAPRFLIPIQDTNVCSILSFIFVQILGSMIRPMAGLI